MRLKIMKFATGFLKLSSYTTKSAWIKIWMETRTKWENKKDRNLDTFSAFNENVEEGERLC